jgi:type I restriction enzyme M protein
MCCNLDKGAIMNSLLAERVGLKAELERLEGEVEKYLKELGYVQ